MDARGKVSRKAIQLTGLALLTLLIVVLGSAIICFGPYQTTPYHATAEYRQQMALLNGLPPLARHPTGDTLQVGWAKVNLQPPFTTPISIDAHRGGKHYTGVLDSVYVRAFVFKMGNYKVAYVTADLLIIPPSVTKLINRMMEKDGYHLNNIYLSATHTHSSIGGWYPTLVGELFAGKYNPKVPEHIAVCIKQAILQAESNCSPCKVGYAQQPTQKLVVNRLVGNKGKVDSILRVVTFEKPGGEKAAILTFAAHATVYHDSLMELSGDWPGLMVQQLEKDPNWGFTAFSAGAVGSQGPYQVYKEPVRQAAYMAEGVAVAARQAMTLAVPAFITSANHRFFMQRVQLYLRKPNLRISDNFALRPWLFYRLFGEEEAFLTVLRLGEVVFVGTPADFSGELAGRIYGEAQLQGSNLLITGFNGAYTGYVTDDRWGDMNAYETRTMNWFGPGYGSYLQEVILNVLKRQNEPIYGKNGAFN